MDKNYNVDDILLEIKRKKAQRASLTPSAPGEPAAPTPQEPQAFAVPESAPEREESALPQVDSFPEPEQEAPPRIQEFPEPDTRREAAIPQPDAFPEPDIYEIPTEPEDEGEGLYAGRVGGFAFKLDAEDELLSAETQATQHLPLSDLDEDGSIRKGGLSAKGWNEVFAAQEEEDSPKPRFFGAAQSGSDEEEDLTDYRSPADRESILHDINTTKISLLIRLAVTFALSLVLIYLGIAKYNFDFPLPEFMLPEEDMRVFMAVNLVLTIGGVLACANMVGSGLVSLFTLKSDADSVLAMACLGVVAQGVVLTLFPEQASGMGINLYFPVLMLSLFFNTVGKLMLINRTHRNFLLVSSQRPKKAVLRMEDMRLARECTRELRQGKMEVAYAAPAQHLHSFLKLSYDSDYEEDLSGILAPVCVGGALLIAIITFVIHKNIFLSMTALSAILCVSAPFTLTLVGNMPLAMAARALLPKGAAISGHEAVEQFHDVDSVIVDATDLFPATSVVMHGMKVFSKSRVDEAILDAASVLCTQRSTLTSAFLQMIGGREDILKPVDSVVYEDGMGISAWVDGKRVLIGSAELMRHHGINTPSRDYEERYTAGGRELLYISNSGELTAMFVLSYQADVAIADSLDYPLRRDMALVVCTVDQHLSAHKIASIFDYPEHLITVIGSGARGEYMQLTRPQQEASAMLAVVGALPVLLRALCGTRILKWSVRIGTIIQLIGIAAGYAMMAFFAFTGSMASADFTALLLYQGFWLLSVLLALNIRRV